MNRQIPLAILLTLIAIILPLAFIHFYQTPEAMLSSPAATHCRENQGRPAIQSNLLYCTLPDGTTCVAAEFQATRSCKHVKEAFDFTSSQDCDFSCATAGYENGDCLRPEESEPAYLAMGHCPSPGEEQQFCYCW
jgi:hypothetical protein